VLVGQPGVGDRGLAAQRVLTFKDVNVEKLDKPDLDLPST